MSIEVTTLDPWTDADEWNRYVERSDGTNPFFRAEALRLQADDTGTTPHLLAGFKGQEAVGLLPIFEYNRGPITGAFSPAPRSWSCYLGPATLNVDKLKRRKADRRVRRFLEGAIEWIEREISPVYTKIVAAEFEDVRPFVWNDFDVQPGYTYVVDLADAGDEEELAKRFSSDARSNVRNADEDAYVVEEGDNEDVGEIVDQVARRYESQGQSFHLSPEFARAAHATLPDGSIRPYVCRVDGDTVGGILVVESDTTRYRWQGGVKPDVDVDLAINDLLDWHVMRDGLREGLERYDLVGAGVPSINRYKAKFNPGLETNYTITSGAFGLDLLVDRYRKLR
ncbi:Acetyltransferase involved in cellulose biosynthesis, CelD/BcsL family [Halobiforma haloterrestris]|uniref:Acetyltransferase involved in cellulose biosynthesis, CelD/BcsL family n=1 Tax=Natronobacterium haloterrestre TaxID=148448 RepID=A0A1I1F588_NATHA|nr:GNAT family N-acetyltransferase [Halobiforma haloterrestris]SFB94116.1 Acetyltransferase involved in cellulose biosynthesis, CelD/BcsL family [Halobiforma haloterrestris]